MVKGADPDPATRERFGAPKASQDSPIAARASATSPALAGPLGTALMRQPLCAMGSRHLHAVLVRTGLGYRSVGRSITCGDRGINALV